MASAARPPDGGGGGDELSAAGIKLTGDDVLARKANNRRHPPARLKGRRVDQTGRLSDDVLVRVLELLPDARDLLSTGALSRRWRNLWTRVPALRFSCSTRPEFFRSAAGAERFVVFVNDALALRAAQSEPGLEHLAISFTIEEGRFRISGEDLQRLSPLSIGAAQGWIHHAVEQQDLKSFDLEIRQPRVLCFRRKPKVLISMRLNCLPSSATLVTMRLALDRAVVHLPATAVFVSLKTLSLQSMRIKQGSCHLLARLLSTACCPCLQKVTLRDLRIHKFSWSKGPLLSLEAAALTEISMEQMYVAVANILQLKTPNLQVLSVNSCMMEALVISAPLMEELYLTSHNDYNIDVEGQLPRVRSLKAELCSHGDHDDDNINDSTIRLLHHCSESVRRLEIYLSVIEREDQIVDIINGRIPHLPHVTSLTIHVYLRELHSLGAGISDILTRCSNLRYLSVRLDCQQICMSYYQESDFLCQPPYHCKPQEISLLHLQDVEFKGLIGTDCELWFMQSIISRATKLQEVSISFYQSYRTLANMGVRDACDLMPELRGGGWTPCSSSPCSSYKWRPHLVGEQSE
ncbi:unnamed protein product [Urochloa humidicola]